MTTLVAVSETPHNDFDDFVVSLSKSKLERELEKEKKKAEIQEQQQAEEKAKAEKAEREKEAVIEKKTWKTAKDSSKPDQAGKADPKGKGKAGGAGAEGDASKTVKGESKDNAAKSGAETKAKAAPTPARLVDNFYTNIDKLWAASEEEIETGVSLLLSVIAESDAKVQVAQLIKLVTVLQEKPSSFTNLKLQLLTSTFNAALFENKDAALQKYRSSVYSTILKFAQATNNASAVVPSFSNLDIWITEWALNPNETCDLYLLASELCKAAKQHGDSQQLVNKYLRAVEKAPSAVAASKEPAAAAVIAALQSPSGAEIDTLIGLAAVKNLEKDKKYEPLYKLLQIFSSGSAEAYLKFAGEQKSFITSQGLDHTDLLKKMRTLTLCSLGAEVHRLTYAEIAQRLLLQNNDEVESAVLDAVLSGRLEAKIDQETQVVVIQRASQRSFQADTWRQLQSKLNLWQRNIQHVLQSLHEVQSRAHQRSDYTGDVAEPDIE